MKKQIKRSELIGLARTILAPYEFPSGEPVDVLLFKLIDDRPVKLVERSELITMDGKQKAYVYDTWVSEMHEFDSTMLDENGIVQEATTVCGEYENGEFVARPDLQPIPRYTSELDWAFSFKNSVLGFSRRLLIIEEIEVEGIDPQLYRAKIVDSNGNVLSSAETDTGASAIILAVLNDLVSNPSASWWIDVTD